MYGVHRVPVGCPEPLAMPPKPVRVYFERCPLCGGRRRIRCLQQASSISPYRDRDRAFVRFKMKMGNRWQRRLSDLERMAAAAERATVKPLLPKQVAKPAARS
jgi:hypothetical protein